MPRYESDVIVIGAGIAGVAAAIDLLDRGRKVLLLDRDVEAEHGRPRQGELRRHLVRRHAAAAPLRHS